MQEKIEFEIVSYEDIPEYTGFKNIETIEIADGAFWDGHAYGFYVGRILDNGKKESAYKKDIKNNNTELFDRLCKDVKLYKKRSLYIGEDLKDFFATAYYIPYKVKNHSSNKPTVKDTYVDKCSNVRYSVEYEILLVAGENYERYITESYETEGGFATSFFDCVTGIEDLFEEWFEENSHGFKEYDGEKEVTFYDPIGRPNDINIDSMEELLSMISSIRVIKCDREIIKK